MSDKRKSGVPFESDDAAEQQLWSELEASAAGSAFAASAASLLR